MERQSWDEYFCSIAERVATRSTCPRLSVGTVLVRNRHIISTGYNGSPHGDVHCIDVGCDLVDNHCQRTIHSEINAIKYATGDTRYTVAYVTHSPCLECFRALYLAGVKRIVYIEPYKAVDYQKALKLSNNEMPDVLQLNS